MVIIGGRDATAENREIDLDRLLTDALATQTLRDAVAAVVHATGLPKREVYSRALSLSSGKT